MASPVPKRQERGKRRMASILDVASGVFAEVGYDAATTNEIAARADISPGSLYQFFPNKQAIADALITRYVDDMRAMQDATLDPSLARLPLEEMIDRVIDPMVAFHVANPAAKALLSGAELSTELATSTAALKGVMNERVEALITAKTPRLSSRQRARTAQVCVQIVGALLPMVLAAGPAERNAVVAELKRAVVAYLSSDAAS